MTKISIVKSNGKYKGFECHGHAGYAEEGEDIICAAISMLTINTINSIETLTDDEIEVSADEMNGDMSCYFVNSPSEFSDILMKSLELGLTSVASQYGEQFVTVLTQEV